MLWHVENTALRILGSVHVSDRPLHISERTTDALDGADLLAFEANFDVAPSQAPARYKANDSLSKNVSTSLFADARRLWLEFGHSDEELERHRPWWVAFCLMNAAMAKRGFVSEQGIDRRILNLGKKQNKTLFFLEPVDAGLIPFAKAPAQEQEVFLSRVAQHTEEGLQEVASLVSAWESRNPNLLLPIVERALHLMPITYSAALAGRNRAWVRHLLRLARSEKNAVTVVGMLHMVGPDSIPSLLCAAGHTCSFAHESL
jgi:uncharacterized protein YbaP (TraB family)